MATNDDRYIVAKGFRGIAPQDLERLLGFTCLTPEKFKEQALLQLDYMPVDFVDSAAQAIKVQAWYQMHALDESKQIYKQRFTGYNHQTIPLSEQQQMFSAEWIEHYLQGYRLDRCM
jgi:hypothetical protein